MSETEESAPQAEPSAPSEGPDLRKLVAYSVTTGLCPLIPIPFLDDWTRDLLRRRHVAGIAGSHGLQPDNEALSVLALGEQLWSPSGCLRGCLLVGLLKSSLYVVRKLFLKVFRTVMIFLTLRTCSLELSRSFHEAFLLDHGMRLGALPQDMTQIPRERVLGLRQAVEDTVQEVDAGPVTRVVRATLASSGGLLRHAAKSLGKKLQTLRRRQTDEAEIGRQLDLEGSEELSRLIDELTTRLANETEYLEELKARLEQRLGVHPTS